MASIAVVTVVTVVTDTHFGVDIFRDLAKMYAEARKVSGDSGDSGDNIEYQR